MNSKGDPLSVLEVIPRLEVGPVIIEPNRLTAPYRIPRKGKTETFDLAYRFEEPVFVPGEPESLNLASMIGVQVAINYGLFCGEIVFHGTYDEADRKFINNMMENTAREIYVKKFLEPNPFLRGAAVDLPVVKKKSYSRANLLFDGSGPLKGESSLSVRIPWDVESRKHAVLSSGGKDSLLSFGLLREMGREVHPVFINESGRHWYTALNAYRYFSQTFPETSRVWTNSDRLFAWMLRHFPFIRQDFSSVRSDEYPIRLWTVAVFLFGALPVLRKRKIGRLVIGDEYDTTRSLSFRGVRHYDGLYDQSRYFDEALTRYYERKEWRVEQLSLIRPLAELLIEKILAERYPDLQRHQVSCHAAHIDGERVFPCGKCEKCRRIVGMLMAFGADPGLCGYTREQIADCLEVLVAKGLHQEAAAVQHLTYLLQEKGLVSKTQRDSARSHPRPEILKVRIDPERSSYETIPPDLRHHLFGIYLDHALGTVRKEGRSWVEIDLYKELGLPPSRAGKKSPPVESAEKSQSRKAASHAKPYTLGELTWPRAEERFKEVDIALLPVGSIEQHGPHLPLDTDSFDASYLADRVAILCSDPKPIVLPLIPYGVSYHHEDFSGTISISPETLSRLVYEVGLSCARHGIKKIVVINGHAGNVPALQFASQKINRDSHIFTCVESGETSDTDVHTITETPNDVHAGEIETSTSLAVRPELVELNKARKFVPRFSSRYLNFSSKRSVEWYARTAKISRSGVLGDPTKASREKGEQIWKMMIAHLVEFVEDLKSMTLEEIYQKRY